MKIWQSALLGLLQGLTEFIPVSSSGHLVLLKRYLHADSDVPLLLEVSVHMGTLIALILVYRRKLIDLLGYVLFTAPGKCKDGGLKAGLWEDNRGKTVLLLFLACIPTVIMGVLFKGLFERLFSYPPLTSMALITTGILLFSTRWIPKTRRDKGKSGIITALFIGFVQGLAIIPGLSRSGSTISSGMWAGMNRSEAADFSFLLSIPAIIGAFSLVLRDITLLPAGEIPSILAGFAVAAVSGYFSLVFLLKYIRKGGLHNFAWYCWCLGLVSLAGYYI
jgi:undecaprenyl-diphosphatase